MPDTLTSLPGEMPPASAKYASIGLALRPERQAGVAERHQHQARHQDDAEDTGADRDLPVDQLSLTGAHLPLDGSGGPPNGIRMSLPAGPLNFILTEQ